MPMSDTLKKVLLGAVVGALLVVFYSHVSERARQARPGRQRGRARERRGAGGADPGRRRGRRRPGRRAQPDAGRAWSRRRSRRSGSHSRLEALGTARANESVDITAKVVEPGHRGALRGGPAGARAARCWSSSTARRRAPTSPWPRPRSPRAAASTSAAASCYTTKVLSDAQIEQIEATFKAQRGAGRLGARSRLDDTVIRAPFAGRVGLRRVSVGSLISPGTVITTLDDTSTIKLDFTVPETFLSAVQPGLAIAARSVAYPDAQLRRARCRSIDSRVDPARARSPCARWCRTRRACSSPACSSPSRLSRGAVDALVVPEQALVPEQGNMFVFVVKDGVAEKREVRIGQRRVGDVQVARRPGRGRAASSPKARRSCATASAGHAAGARRRGPAAAAP